MKHFTMKPNLVATVETMIGASIEKVWRALTDPGVISQYMFGTKVESDWKEGSPISWKGVWQGKDYEDKGKILHIEQNRFLQYTHFSPLSGQEDIPSNYHTVWIELKPAGDHTSLRLSQDNNATEAAKQHSENNWSMMLASLKKLLEENS